MDFTASTSPTAREEGGGLARLRLSAARLSLLVALAGLAFLAALVLPSSGSGHVLAPAAHDDRNGRIAFEHYSFTQVCCHVTIDVATIEPDGSDFRQLTDTRQD